MFFYNLGQTSRNEIAAVNTRLEKIDLLIAHTDAAVQTLNDPHTGIKGTMQDINAMILQFEETSSAIREDAEDQKAGDRAITDKTAQLLTNANVTVTKLNQSVDTVTIATTNALDSIPPSLTYVNLTLNAATRLANDSSLILESPTVAATQANIESISKDSKDVADYYRNVLLAPKRWYQKVENVAKHVKNCCIPAFF